MRQVGAAEIHIIQPTFSEIYFFFISPEYYTLESHEI